MEPLNVSAIIVTRGDVDLRPVLDSLPQEWEQIIWNNSGSSKGATCSVRKPGQHEREPGTVSLKEVAELSVYGRYAAIEYASHDIIYVQDDDCIVSSPEAIIEQLVVPFPSALDWQNRVVCNMPQEFRHSFYEDHALVGFGAAFHRDAPVKAFKQIGSRLNAFYEASLFRRTCDIVFTALTPRVLVDVPVTHLPHAYNNDRMYRQPEHVDERRRMLELALQVKEAR